MTEPTGTTAADTAALRSAARDVDGAATALQSGLAAYDSIPIETLSVVLGPMGGDFLAAFDAATGRHRDVVRHAERVLDASGRLMVATADAYELVDGQGADALRTAGADATGASGTWSV